MNGTQTLNLAPAETIPGPPAARAHAPQTGTSTVPPASPVPALRARIPAPSRRLLASIVVLLLFAVAVYGSIRWWLHFRAWTGTDNAYVSAHVHTISARVPGTVLAVLVDENQAVTNGAVLARLDPGDYQVRRDQAQAQLAQAAAKIEITHAELAQAQAQVEREQARSNRAARDLDRATTLANGIGAAISRQEFDAFKAEAEAATAALAGAQSAVGSARAAVLAAMAQEQSARAALSDAELQLSYSEIRAPAAGRIGKRNLETGNRVQPGQAVLALVQDDVWITANYRETQLTHMQPGQVVQVRIDAFPGRVFTGRVDSLSPASGAQFALLPPDNATGNFTRIVQRVPVKIVLDRQSLGACEGRILPGMSAIVEVKTRA